MRLETTARNGLFRPKFVSRRVGPLGRVGPMRTGKTRTGPAGVRIAVSSWDSEIGERGENEEKVAAATRLLDQHKRNLGSCGTKELVYVMERVIALTIFAVGRT